MEASKHLRHVLAKPAWAVGGGDELPISISLKKWAWCALIMNKSLKSKANKEAP